MADEAAEFRVFLERNLARLSDLAAEWTSRLSAHDRDWLTVTALNIAYERRKQFDPRRVSIVRWFEGCMQAAADRRPAWEVITCTGWVVVPAHKLRQRKH